MMGKTDMRVRFSKLPSREALDKAFVEVSSVHEKYLKVSGVKLPQKGNQVVWLAVLFLHIGCWVHKDDIAKVVQSQKPTAGQDQQIRHLKRAGWNLESDGHGWHRITDPRSPSTELSNDQIRRGRILTASSFDDLKLAFDNACATCGAVEGKRNKRYGNDKVVLQQGHRDPFGPSNVPSNIIPQCQFCNRAYRNDFVFDEKGRVHAVASIEAVRRASNEVKQKIIEYLLEPDSQ